MTIMTVVPHLNSGHEVGPLSESGKFLSSESSGSEKIEDTGERHTRPSHHLRSSSTHRSVMSGFTSAMDDGVFDYDSQCDYTSTSSFEFQKGYGVNAKALAVPYLNKAAPSKWDDAEKWLVSQSPGEARTKTRTKSGPLHGHGGPYTSKKGHDNDCHADMIAYESHGGETFWVLNGGSHHQKMKLVANPHYHGSFDLPMEWTKKMDVGKGLAMGPNLALIATPTSPQKEASFDCYPVTDDPVDMKVVNVTHEGSYDKPMMRTRKPTSDSLASVPLYAPPAPPVRSVSMRDMGTEMTPIASQEPSRTGTPLCAATPMLHSPASSSPSTPTRSGSPSAASPVCVSGAGIRDLEVKKGQKEMQLDMGSKDTHVLGSHVGGKAAMVAWASKEDEDSDASKLLKNIDLEEVKKNVLETRAVAWEDAEQSKFMARFKREEAKILAWENHQRTKAEDEMRRIEVKVEKKRSHAHETLMNKLAAARRKVEQRLAAAEAKRCEQASKTARRADYIRQTGRLPSSSSYFSCGLCRH